MAATPEPEPRATETPLPIVWADAPPHDVELGVTTSDEPGQWATVPVARTAVTRTYFAATIAGAGLTKLRYVLIRTGWHRRKQ